jgi:hypothetical protein
LLPENSSVARVQTESFTLAQRINAIPILSKIDERASRTDRSARRPHPKIGPTREPVPLMPT